MNRYTFSYSYSDDPEVFTTSFECESLTEAFDLFYDRTTDVDSGRWFDSVPKIYDLTIESVDHLYTSEGN